MQAALSGPLTWWCAFHVAVETASRDAGDSQEGPLEGKPSHPKAALDAATNRRKRLVQSVSQRVCVTLAPFPALTLSCAAAAPTGVAQLRLSSSGVSFGTEPDGGEVPAVIINNALLRRVRRY